jgi:polyphosphate kinase
MLADNRHAWELQPDGNYIQRCPGDNCPEANSQKTILSMALRTAGIN